MKNLMAILVFILSTLAYGQEEIKMPELDTENDVYTLKFGPDQQNKEVISAYMKGTTEKDSLRFWAEGTILTQRVMVTVLLENKSDKVKVDIVKNNWEDSKISGETKMGSFQEYFDTAGKFGIVITSETPNTPFYLAVWCGGERVQNLNAIYRPVASHNGKINATGPTQNLISTQQNTSMNIVMYLLIGALLIIILLLAIMVFKKRKNSAITIFIFLLAGQQCIYAGAEELEHDVFGGVGIKYPSVLDIIKFAAQLPEWQRQARRYLDPENDQEGEAGLNPPGGPGIPSSCIPDQFQEEDIQEGHNGRDGIDGRDGRDGRDASSGNNGSDGSDGNDGIDASSGSNGSDGSDGNDGSDGRNRNNDKYKPEYDDSGRPKYDIDGKPINYDNSKYPKYDKNGNLIEYGEIDPKGNFDIYGRPRFDKNKEAIQYDNPKRPKYDSKGVPINYDKRDTNKPEKVKSTSKNSAMSFRMEIKSLNSSDSNTRANTIQYAQASMFPDAISVLMFSQNQNREEGCNCLEKEYKKLNDRRVNLEKLRIIYAHAMKKINAGIAFGDGVSAVHGVSALVWQKQKMIILKESIPTLNKAYDDKYAEMIEALQENLKEIDRCEALLGYKDWYNHAGFIYYQFMADKYKRK